MHHSAYVNCEKFVKKYYTDLKGVKVLDVGSYDVNGTLRPIFDRADYIGLDMEKGPNVDVVAHANNMPFDDNHFDLVVSSSCFEHDDMFWETFLEMARVVKPGGLMYVQAPSNGPYHGWPGDNWRFYADSWKALAKWGKHKGYDIDLLESYIDTETPDPTQRRIWDDSVAFYRKNDKVDFDFNEGLSLKNIERGHLKTTYRGVPYLKDPFDYVIYQMLLEEIKPDLVIEIGTLKGGGALYLADLMELMGKGEVHTINVEDDVSDDKVINHKRIRRFVGGYENYDLNIVKDYETVLIIDDGSHTSYDVYNAFVKFHNVVTIGSYYIIEDGILTYLGYEEQYDGGPLKAISKILEENSNFLIDNKWCNFYGDNITFNTKGYLKRVI